MLGVCVCKGTRRRIRTGYCSTFVGTLSYGVGLAAGIGAGVGIGPGVGAVVGGGVCGLGWWEIMMLTVAGILDPPK